MGYRVNVDIPTRLATIHTVNDNPECQPRDKRPENGYWAGPFATKEEATQVASESGLRVHLCQVCNP